MGLTIKLTAMSKTYTRIDIKSVDDLPKESGEYVVNVRDNTGIDVYKYFDYINPVMSEHQKEYWLNTFDWYLIEDTEPSYPEEFVIYCIEMTDMEEREEVDYCYAVWNNGNVLGFDTLDELYNYWLTNIKG